MYKTLIDHTLYQAMQCLFNPLPLRQVIGAGAQKHLIVSGGIVFLTCQNNSANVSELQKNTMSRESWDSEREEKILFLKLNNGTQYNAKLKVKQGCEAAIWKEIWTMWASGTKFV